MRRYSMKIVNIRKNEIIPDETVRNIKKIIEEDKKECVIYADKIHVQMDVMNRN